MKKILLVISLLLAVNIFVENKLHAQSGNAVLRHVIIITFKKDASADSINALDKIYTDLSKSPMVKDFETGVNISMRDTGVIKHIYVTSFASKEDMAAYKKIPHYQDLFKLSLAVADDLSVVDYWVKK